MEGLRRRASGIAYGIAIGVLAGYAVGMIAVPVRAESPSAAPSVAELERRIERLETESSSIATFPLTVRVPDGPSITYADAEALVRDIHGERVRLDELRDAIDWEAAHRGDTIPPSLHEWADGRKPGEFGGGRK